MPTVTRVTGSTRIVPDLRRTVGRHPGPSQHIHLGHPSRSVTKHLGWYIIRIMYIYIYIYIYIVSCFLDNTVYYYDN